MNKVFDGTTTAAVTLLDNRIAGDIFTDNYTSASFLDPFVGNSKTVNVSGISITGLDSVNYNLLNTTAVTTANITASAFAPPGWNNGKKNGWDGGMPPGLITLPPGLAKK